MFLCSSRFALAAQRLTLGLGHLGAAASGRRQARDHFRFPLNHLGIRASLALGKLVFDEGNGPVDLLVRERLNGLGQGALAMSAAPPSGQKSRNL